MNTLYLTELPADWNEYAKVFTALGDATRQRILLLFEPDEEISLKTLVDLFPLSRTALSYHVNSLEQAGLLSCQKRGREVFYKLETSPVFTALESVLDYARQLKMQAPK